ncbi:MAG TPA: hypothetical protein DCM28_02350 [Phycisphaerales bacterium]|nr:hypothetical protein [Phycisphaerales bacterium]|tara:strand:- start:1500 stop:2894 length:1395 start_codon:yes stop_codon:yes gene_type:complete
MFDDGQQLDLEAAPSRLHRSRHRKAAMLLLISGGLPTVATFLGFLGLLWWPFEIISNYRPQYALILVGVMIAMLFTKRFFWALLLLLPIAMNLALIVPLYIPTQLQLQVQERQQKAMDEAARLALNSEPHPPRNFESNNSMAQIIRYDENAKVMRDGLMWYVSDEPIMIMNLDMNVAARGSEHVMSLINDGQADIILAQSVTQATLKQLSMYGTPYRIHNSLPQEDGYGIALLSRVSLPPKIRVIDSTTVELSHEQPGPPALKVTIQWFERRIQLLMVHLPGPWTANNAKVYREQFESIVTWVNEQDDPVVVMGNFNATPWSAHFSAMLRKTGLINSQIGFGIQPTWPASGGFPLGEIPVDHCLHSQQLVSVERGSGPTNGAAHRPMIVKLNWRTAQEKPTPEEQAKEKEAIVESMKQKRSDELSDSPKKKPAVKKKSDAKKKSENTKQDQKKSDNKAKATTTK